MDTSPASSSDSTTDGTAGEPKRRPRRGMLSRRAAIGLGAGLAIAGVGGGVAYAQRGELLDIGIRRQLSQEPDARFTANDGRVRVVLCGTGSPEVGNDAAQACTLISAAGKIFVFDTGEGATHALVTSGVDLAAVQEVFITHLHSDHFSGLGSLITESGIWGRPEPVRVTGPSGIDDLVTGLKMTFARDEQLRAEHMGDVEEGPGPSTTTVQVAQVPDGDRSVRVYEQDGVTIDAVLVDHRPVVPAFGYVLRYRGTKVFVSGDTIATPQNLPWMQDADLVVHEAYATHLVDRAIPIMRDLGQDLEAQVAMRTRTYHADTLELADLAQEANVKHLALTHLIPYPQNLVARRAFTAGMGDRYDGELTLGEDGMVFEL